VFAKIPVLNEQGAAIGYVWFLHPECDALAGAKFKAVPRSGKDEKGKTILASIVLSWPQAESMECDKASESSAAASSAKP
jgi:hypothetical protein